MDCFVAFPGNTKGLYKRFEIVYFRYEVRFQKTLMQRNCVDTFSQTANVLEEMLIQRSRETIMKHLCWDVL